MPSDLLSRRSSLKPRRSVDCAAHTVSYTTSKLPVEVLDKIVLCKILETGRKGSFSAIAAFSLACYQFRQVAFRIYFTTLHAYKKALWNKMCGIPGMYGWVRYLSVSTSAICIQIENIRRFSNLAALSIDFSSEGSSTYFARANLILSNVASITGQPSRMENLELSFIPSVTPQLCSLIASYFPSLEGLILSSAERLIPDCCWTCYEEAASCTVHSPIPDYYCDISQLTREFGKALAPLVRLKHLHLGIYLSPVDTFYEHIEHASYPPPPLPGAAVATTVAAPNPFNFFHPPPYSPRVCEECQEYGCAEEDKLIEDTASEAIAGHLENLQCVCWATWYPETSFLCPVRFGCWEPGQQVDTVTFWVKRDVQTGKVTVRRRPWGRPQ